MSERPMESPKSPPSSEPGATTRIVVLEVASAEKTHPDESASFRSPLAAVRSAVDELFADVAPEALEAIRMAAGELAENVVKYGEETDGSPGQISFTRTPQAVEIRTTNRLTNATQTADLFARLRKIGEAEDLCAQFVERMSEIMNEPNQHSTALGLLRVGYEGSFQLSGSYANTTVTIVATRSIQ